MASTEELSPCEKRPRLDVPTVDDGAHLASVPLVDIGPFIAAAGRPGKPPLASELPEAAKAAARSWKTAFSSFGFAQVVGHGISDEVIEETYSSARRFFSQSPEDKRLCDLGKGYGAGGYTAQGVERVNATASRPDGSSLLGAEKARPPDRVESMVIHKQPSDLMPSKVEGFESSVYRYHEEMTGMLRSVMRITACALDMPLDHFDSYFFNEGATGPHEKMVGELSLRLAYYPAWKEGEEPAQGQLRYGEHTDYTGYTFLWQDHNTRGPQTAKDGAQPPRGGLQVQLPNGSFVDCPPIPGAFTVNAGDLVQVWTNDVLLSNVHRVLNPPPGDRDDRISLVFFTGPTPDTVVEALPSCCGPDRPARYAPLTAGEHLARKIAASNR